MFASVALLSMLKKHLVRLYKLHEKLLELFLLFRHLGRFVGVELQRQFAVGLPNRGGACIPLYLENFVGTAPLRRSGYCKEQY